MAERGAPKVAVLGAGIVGLSAAQLMQDKLKGVDISVIAECFNVQTTSNVAAGLFTVRSSFRGPSEEVTRTWVKDSWDYWYEKLQASDASLAGITQLSTYIFSKEHPKIVRNPLIENLVPLYRAATEEELKLCGDGWKYGSFLTTLLVDNKKYLPWAEKSFKNAGGKLVKRKITNLSQLNEFDVVINCSGLGAQELCRDDQLRPMRGQVTKVKAPWIKTAFYGDHDAYIIPGFDGSVTLGGTRQFDSYNLSVCPHDAAAIMDRCCQLLPGLRKSEIISQEVGLRPYRAIVRVEAENMSGRRVLHSRGMVGAETHTDLNREGTELRVELSRAVKESRVVHCYGHGGYGVCMAPGTAKHAVDIAFQLLRSNIKNKL